MTARPILRPEARTALLQALAGLGASTAEDRAAAALDAHRIAMTAGIVWGKLIEPDPRAEIEQLLMIQTLPQADRDQLALMLRWRRIGEPGREIIESIKQRLAGARADLTALKMRLPARAREGRSAASDAAAGCLKLELVANRTFSNLNS